jgi:hypothetical protein
MDFWLNSFAVMTRNACRLLRLAGEPVTLRTLVEVVADVPRSSQEYTVDACEWSAFWRTMKEACVNYADTPEEWRCQELINYFMYCAAGFDWARDWTTRTMVAKSFVTIAGMKDRELEGIEDAEWREVAEADLNENPFHPGRRFRPGGHDWPVIERDSIDRRREWAAIAAAEIVNLHWTCDSPKYVIYSEIEKVVLATLCRAVAETRNDMLRGSEN